MTKKANGKALAVQDDGTKSREQIMAELTLGGIANGTVVAADYAKAVYGEADLTECMKVMRQKADDIQGGNLAQAEALLTAQAISLDSIYAALARRALLNIGEYMGATETYLRLALKAQNQCRATLETLATIKNPPIVMARQANITTGPQQVNNGTLPARAEKSSFPPNGLLEASHEQPMDTGAARPAGASDPALETVGAVNRPQHA